MIPWKDSVCWRIVLVLVWHSWNETFLDSTEIDRDEEVLARAWVDYIVDCSIRVAEVVIVVHRGWDMWYRANEGIVVVVVVASAVNTQKTQTGTGDTLELVVVDDNSS